MYKAFVSYEYGYTVHSFALSDEPWSSSTKFQALTTRNFEYNFWLKHKICPACRNYELEKSWCHNCNKTGIVAK